MNKIVGDNDRGAWCTGGTNYGNTEDSWLRGLSSNCQHRISLAGDSSGRAWNTNLSEPTDNETEEPFSRAVCDGSDEELDNHI